VKFINSNIKAVEKIQMHVGIWQFKKTIYLELMQQAG